MEALAYPLFWTDKRRQRGTRKGKVVWPGGSRRRPTGGRCSLCRTGKDGKVSRPWGGKGKVVWPGGSRRRPTGD